MCRSSHTQSAWILFVPTGGLRLSGCDPREPLIRKERMVQKCGLHLVLLFGIVLALGRARAVVAAKDVSYATAVTDDAGTSHSITFEGQVDGPTLTGTITVDGTSQTISAFIAKDGSISGTVAGADGKPAGKFWGQRSGGQVKGSFDLNGRVGDWSVPASKIPVPK